MDNPDLPDEGSVTAENDAEVEPASVAPTDANSVNTIRIPIAPIACWRLADPAFAFDSSFVAPSFSGEVAALASLVSADDKKGCPAAIFGHADPVGSDDVNKTISDRRAIAIYALLTRQPKMWEDLYSTPADGDAWGTRSIQTMLGALMHSGDGPYYAGPVDGIYGQGTSDAVERFQGENGLAVDGKAGPNTRAKLFPKYMDLVCTPDPTPTSPTPKPFQMQASDFLGGGADGGKMAMQGCSRFNPVKLLPNSVMNGSDQDARNAQDAPNRRVLLYLFRKGTKITKDDWPCPRVKESASACKAQFWPDGDTRRQNGDQERRYLNTHDTMACRFYDRLARRSPCEGGHVTAPSLRASLFVDFATDPQLLVFNGAGSLAQTLKKEQGKLSDGGLLAFNLDPTKLPNPVQLVFDSSYGPQPHGGLFDPIALRSALVAGDTDAASAIFFAADSASAKDEAAAPGPSSTSASSAPTQGLQLVITYDNPKHRYLSQLDPQTGGLKCFEGTSDSDMQRVTNERKVNTRGDRFAKHTFVIKPESTKVHVFVRIVDARNANQAVLAADQFFEVRRSSGAVELVPIWGNQKGLQGLHPRFRLGDVKVSGNGVVALRLDTLFLNVTGTKAVSAQLDAQFGTPFHTLPTKCRYDIVEYTRAVPGTFGIATWAVITPPSAKPFDEQDLKFLLFFTHELKPYIDSDHVNYHRLTQYFATPANVASFFPDGNYSAYPNFGWEEQLIKSGKPVIILFPFPKEDPFGDMASPLGAGDKPDFPTILQSLMVCMWGPESGTRGSRKRAKWFGAGGWSSGTNTLLSHEWLGNPLIDEIYAFDGDSKSQPFFSNLPAWMRPGRKLRMIGTAYTEVQALQVKEALSGNSDVSKMPEDLGFWYHDGTYASAHDNTFGANPALSSGFRSFMVPKPGDDVTELTDVWLDSAQDIPAGSKDIRGAYLKPFLKLRWHDATTVISRMTNFEAGCLLQFEVRPTLPFRDASAFLKGTAVLNTNSFEGGEPQTVFRHRHPWSVIGGSRDSSGFVTYFQTCLRLSGA